MTKDITIKGKFTIEGLEPQMNNFKQPLKYLKLRIGYEPPVFIEAMTSAQIKNDPNREKGEVKDCNHPWQDAKLDCKECFPKSEQDAPKKKFLITYKDGCKQEVNEDSELKARLVANNNCKDHMGSFDIKEHKIGCKNCGHEKEHHIHHLLSQYPENKDKSNCSFINCKCKKFQPKEKGVIEE